MVTTRTADKGRAEITELMLSLPFSISTSLASVRDPWFIVDTIRFPKAKKRFELRTNGLNLVFLNALIMSSTRGMNNIVF